MIFDGQRPLSIQATGKLTSDGMNFLRIETAHVSFAKICFRRRYNELRDFEIQKRRGCSIDQFCRSANGSTIYCIRHKRIVGSK